MGTYQPSASVQNLLPANTMRHLLGQHTGAFSVGHEQCFCNSRKPMPSLLQSASRQVILLMSKVVMPFFTKPTMICLDCWNTFSRFSFQTKCVCFLTRFWNGSIIGLSEYAHATWLTSPNQDLVLMIFWWAGKLEIAFSKFSQGVTPVIWRPPNWTTSLAELEFLSVEDNYIFCAQQ